MFIDESYLGEGLNSQNYCEGGGGDQKELACSMLLLNVLRKMRNVIVPACWLLSRPEFLHFNYCLLFLQPRIVYIGVCMSYPTPYGQ